jgi:hypothetical protein
MVLLALAGRLDLLAPRETEEGERVAAACPCEWDLTWLLLILLEVASLRYVVVPAWEGHVPPDGAIIESVEVHVSRPSLMPWAFVFGATLVAHPDV